MRDGRVASPMQPPQNGVSPRHHRSVVVVQCVKLGAERTARVPGVTLKTAISQLQDCLVIMCQVR